jgi:hypothetical protein
VVGAWSRAQAEARDHVTGQHGARRFSLLLDVCPGRAGAATVFLLLLLHVARVFWALVVAPFTQLHHAGGNLRPPLRDVHGGAAIGAVIPVILHNEGCELALTAHRWLLLSAPDVGPLQVHLTYLPRYVGALER